MKAVVLEERNGDSVVLKKDGSIVKIHKKYMPGQEIDLPDQKIIRFPQAAILRAAAAILVFALLGSGTYTTVHAASYVTVDVNPSVEFTLNMFDRVIGITALNDDAEALASYLEENRVKWDSLSDAMDKVTEYLENEELFEDESRYMLISVISDREPDRTRLKKAAENAAEKENLTADIKEASINDRKEAISAKMSTGRYEVMKEQIDTEEQKDDSVREFFRSGSLSEIREKGGSAPGKTNGDAGAEMQGQPALSETNASESPKNAGQKPSEGAAAPEFSAPSDKDPQNRLPEEEAPKDGAAPEKEKTPSDAIPSEGEDAAQGAPSQQAAGKTQGTAAPENAGGEEAPAQEAPAQEAPAQQAAGETQGTAAPENAGGEEAPAQGIPAQQAAEEPQGPAAPENAGSEGPAQQAGGEAPRNNMAAPGAAPFTPGP
ncbi:MAG: hypothetical protein K6E30_02920 [Lachnospiraceae bacterium]|nr:hypothetical protein [Lachnospiraceae bacterium]